MSHATLAAVDLRKVTEREREVFGLLGSHLTHEQIGQRLFISVRTVESHVASLRRKLAIPDHRTLVKVAAEHGSAAGTRGAALPAPLTSFIGRERELAGLASALGSSRLVSAVGPGGAGKTRLALSVATALAPGFANGVRWVDLVPVPDGTALEEAVAQACDAVPTARRGPVDAIVAAVRDRPTLLVLDNCEHLVNAVATLAERLLTSCPAVKMLVTSRLRLAVAFERVFPVAGLSTDAHGDAVTLFLERAAAAGAKPLGDPARERISAVCATLGGLPLAIELAAVRLPALSLEGVERGLLNQGELLTGGARLVARHRSMTETLDWSAALLGGAAARALCRLAVFVAPFGIDAAAAVAGFSPLRPDEVPAALAELTEHNLLVAGAADGRAMYRMLEPVRQYGVATMAAADKAAFSQHFAWCLRSVRHAVTGTLPGAQARLLDETRQAIAWGVTHGDPAATADLASMFGRLLFGAGRLREAQARLEQAAELTADPAWAAADLQDAAAIAKCRVRGADALRLELAAADRARAAGRPVTAALALTRAAELMTRFPGMFGGRPSGDTAPFLAKARNMAPDDPHVAAAIEVAGSGYAGPHGIPAPEQATRVVAAARAVGDPILESSALDSLISAMLFAFDIQAAHALAQERVARLRALGAVDPATALELKDALHVATFCALGSGHLDIAMRMAHSQHELPFLRESLSVAEDELMAPAVLAGDLRTAVEAGERFLQDWIGDGRPVAAGRALTPAAVALAHGLLGNDQAREDWLAVVAEMRGVPRVSASRGTGYGELFEAMALLHGDRPHEAYDVLTADSERGLYGAVFHQWTAAVTAQAAVLAGRPDAGERIERAARACSGNPAATTILNRAIKVHRTNSSEQDARPA